MSAQPVEPPQMADLVGVAVAQDVAAAMERDGADSIRTVAWEIRDADAEVCYSGEMEVVPCLR